MNKQTFKEWKEELSRDKLFLVTCTIILLACLFIAIYLLVKGDNSDTIEHKMEMCMEVWYDFRYCKYKIYGVID